MEATGRYRFNLPWPAVILGFAFYGGLSAYVVHLSTDFAGVVRVILLLAGVVLAVLAIIMLTRRAVFPRFLVVEEDAIVFPQGFPRASFVRVGYSEIVRIFEAGEALQAGLYLGTVRGDFEIPVGYFSNSRDYAAVRDVISREMGVRIEGPILNPVLGEQLPKPLMHWTEPDDWARYRASEVRRTSLARRLLKCGGFFVCWLGIFVLPWLALRFFDIPTAPTASYMGFCCFVAFFFSVLSWVGKVRPVHCTEISVRKNGITQNFGKQKFDRAFQNISGWRMIEREFEGRTLHILLFKLRHGVSAIALCGAEPTARLSEILREKGVLECSELTAPWE
jgi:hypothetical protein